MSVKRRKHKRYNKALHAVRVSLGDWIWAKATEGAKAAAEMTYTFTVKLTEEMRAALMAGAETINLVAKVKAGKDGGDGEDC